MYHWWKSFHAAGSFNENQHINHFTRCELFPPPSLSPFFASWTSIWWEGYPESRELSERALLHLQPNGRKTLGVIRVEGWQKIIFHFVLVNIILLREAAHNSQAREHSVSRRRCTRSFNYSHPPSASHTTLGHVVFVPALVCDLPLDVVHRKLQHSRDVNRPNRRIRFHIGVLANLEYPTKRVWICVCFHIQLDRTLWDK